MKSGRITTAVLLLITAPLIQGFVLPKSKSNSVLPKASFSHQPFATSVQATSSASSDVPGTGKTSVRRGKSMEELRREGGFLTVNTPIGALNPFGLYYGFVSLFLGIPWFIALKICQFVYWVSGGRLDKKVSDL